MPEATEAAPATPPATPPAVPPAAPEATPPAQPAAAPAEGEGTTPAPGTGIPAKSQMIPRARVDQITKEKWDEKRRADAAETRAKELEEENKRLKAGQAPAPSAPQPGTPAPSTTPAAPAAPAPAAAPPATPAAPGQPLEQLADALAEQKVAQREFVRQCNTVYDKGKKEIPDFEQAMKGFDVFGGLQRFPTFVQAAVGLENAHKVLHQLGNNLDEAERILSLPPVQQAVELAKLDLQIKNTVAAPPVSQAPRPVAPVAGASGDPTPTPDDDGDFKSQEDYRKYREKNFKKR